MFHTQDLLLGVGVIGDVNELSNLRRVDLFVFTVELNKIRFYRK
jgi:hypothetical protein